MKRILSILLVILPFISFAQTRLINLSNMIQPGSTPTISLTTASISLPATVQGNNSTISNFQANGAFLTGTGSVNSPGTWLDISLDQVTWTNTSLSLPVSGGNFTGHPVFIYVRSDAGATPNSYSGNISVASAGAATQNVAVTVTITAPGASLGVSTNSLVVPGTTAGTQGPGIKYTLTGSNLGSNIVTVTAPTDLLVSKDSSTWSQSVTVTPSGGSINQSIWIAIASTAAAQTNTSKNVTNSATGANTQNVLSQYTVTSPGSNDTVNVNIWDGAVGQVTTSGWNNWQVGESATPQTSPALNRSTGVASGYTATISIVDIMIDNYDNGAGYGNATTAAFPGISWRAAAAVANGETLTLTLNSLNPAHHYNLNLASGRNTATSRPASYAITGFSTQNLDAKQNINTILNWTGIVPNGSGQIVVTITESNLFAYINALQLIDTH